MQRQYGATLWSRDSCGGGGKSIAGEKVSFGAQQMCHFIAGKMTSAMQVTDTDFAYRLKALATSEGRKLKRDLMAARVQAVDAGMTEDVDLPTWGNVELLEVISRSVKALKEIEQAEGLTLKAD